MVYGFRVQGLGCGFRVQDLGFRVPSASERRALHEGLENLGGWTTSETLPGTITSLIDDRRAGQDRGRDCALAASGLLSGVWATTQGAQKGFLRRRT